MPLTRVPPLRTPLMIPSFDRDGKLLALAMAPVWQRWFTEFQEAADVTALTLAQLQAGLDGVETHVDTGLAGLRTALETRLDSDEQSIIDAGAAIQFGEDYQGAWSDGTYAVGEVVYFSGLFYECDVARNASHTSNPGVDTANWSPKVAEANISGNVNVDLSSITAEIQNVIDSQGTAAYGEDYQGSWSAGVYGVGDAAYYSGAFYTCTVARTTGDPDDPATDTASWEVDAAAPVVDLSSIETSLADLGTDISEAQQAQIDAIGANAFGDDYEGAWAAGTYAVGEIVYHDGMFYDCTVARAATDTDDPTVDTASWDVADSSVTIDLSSIETSLSDIATDLGTVQTVLTAAVQDQIDAQATADYGDKYRGAWVPGVYALGDVAYFSGAYYTCDVARAATDTDDPTVDTAAWSIKVATVGDTGITQAVQNAIDSQARGLYGTDYRGAWSAGDFAVGDVVYFEAAYYVCTNRRTPAHTNDPTVNTGSWDPTERTVQESIDASARGLFGAAYQGAWSPGVYAVGEVVYFSGGYYECESARAATDTDDPTVDTTGWGPKASISGGVTAAVRDAIDAGARRSFGDKYKGTWEAGVYAVGNVVYFAGSFYEADVTRAATDTDDPATDTTGWSAKVSIEDGTSQLVQDAIDAGVEATGASQFGPDFEGEWSAGNYGVGNVVSYNRRYYRCTVARTAANTNNPSVNTSAWEPYGSAAVILAQEQSAVNAVGHGNWGERYQGRWAPGNYLVGDYVSHEGIYYRATAARTVANTTAPDSDSNWTPEGSSFTLEGNIETASQSQIDAAARITYGEDYQGAWERGVYAVDAVVFHDGEFYECQVARTNANNQNPSNDANGWDLIPSLKKNVADSTGLSQVKSQAFTSSGTWIRPNNVGHVRVVLVGGGGGGGGSSGSGGGGAGGQVVISLVSVTGNVTVTIGSGGLGGFGLSPSAEDGGDTSFGSLAKAFGGNGARVNFGGSGPFDQPSLIATENAVGGDDGEDGSGLPGFGIGGISSNTSLGGGGGGSYGPGADGSGTSGTPGDNADDNSGGGGGGGRTSFGGNGGSGYAVVFWSE